MHGDMIPKKKVDNVLVEKSYEDLDDKDKVLLSKNARAKHYLFCGLDRDIFNSVENASSAHDIWKILEVTHQGTNSMKETKINILVQKYELFKMHHDETIAQMFSRFTTITNDLNALGKSFTSTELVNKILRSLPKAFQSKVVAIREARDLSKLSIEELMGSLMTHEIMMKDHDEDEEKNKKKKKSLALKSFTKNKEDEEEIGDSELEDFTLLSKKLKKYSKLKKESISKANHNGNKHPMKKKSKKKAFKASWDSSSESESEVETQEEVSYSCFMAINDEVSSLDSSDSSDNDNDDLSYDELLNDFHDLHKNYEKLILKNGVLKKKLLSISNDLEDALKEKEKILTCDLCVSFEKEKASLNEKVSSLENSNNSLHEENCTLTNENASLNAKILDLTEIVHKFTNAKKTFDMMLGGQKCVLNKGGIEFKPFIKTKYLKNYFVEASSSSDSKYVCNYCNQNGHTSFSCPIKKNAYFGVTQKWEQKAPKTNSLGPKAIWVPKPKL